MTGHEKGRNRVWVLLAAVVVVWTRLGGDLRADGGVEEGPPELGEASTLDEYLAFAAHHNAELAAAFHRWQAAVSRIAQVKSLPDPKFTYGYYIQEVETRVGPQRHRLGLSQTIPWFGKLRLRGEMMAEEAHAMEEEMESVRLRLNFRVKEAWHELAYLRQAIGITEDNIRLMGDLEGVAQARLKAGGALTEVVKAQVELGKLRDRLRTLEDMRGPLVARLNAALNRPVDTPFPWPSGKAELAVDLPEADLAAWLEENNPELNGLEARIVREKKSMDLARRESFPDITLGLDYIETGPAMNSAMPESGKDAVIAMLSVNIPLWEGRNRAARREAESRRDAAERSLEQMGNMLRSDLKFGVYRYRDADRKVRLYRNTLGPLAENALQVAQRAWEAGEGEFLDLIDAQRLRLEFQLEAERAEANRAQRLAEIEMLVGREMPRQLAHETETTTEAK